MDKLKYGRLEVRVLYTFQCGMSEGKGITDPVVSRDTRGTGDDVEGGKADASNLVDAPCV